MRYSDAPIMIVALRFLKLFVFQMLYNKIWGFDLSQMSLEIDISSYWTVYLIASRDHETEI